MQGHRRYRYERHGSLAAVEPCRCVYGRGCRADGHAVLQQMHAGGAHRALYRGGGYAPLPGHRLQCSEPDGSGCLGRDLPGACRAPQHRRHQGGQRQRAEGRAHPRRLRRRAAGLERQRRSDGPPAFTRREGRHLRSVQCPAEADAADGARMSGRRLCRSRADAGRAHTADRRAVQ